MNSQNKKENNKEFSYKETLNLLKTEFSMRANSVIREPDIQKFWSKNSIDLESVPKLIPKPLKEKIKYQAQELNFLKRTSRAKLPIF